jgi:hypothetical protein
MSADKSQQSYYWSELAELTHETQVENFGWCSCEDNEGNENPYADCPRPDLATMTQTFRILRWEMIRNV